MLKLERLLLLFHFFSNNFLIGLFPYCSIIVLTRFQCLFNPYINLMLVERFHMLYLHYLSIYNAHFHQTYCQPIPLG